MNSTQAVSEYLAKIGSKGGRATGKAKRRPRSHYIRIAKLSAKNRAAKKKP